MQFSFKKYSKFWRIQEIPNNNNYFITCTEFHESCDDYKLLLLHTIMERIVGIGTGYDLQLLNDNWQTLQ